MEEKRRQKEITKIKKELLDMNVESIIKLVKADVNRGLSQLEAVERLERYGYNEIPQKEINPIISFLEGFWGIIPWMLELVTLAEFLLKRYADALVVSLLLLFNAIVFFAYERNTANTIKELKKKLYVNSRVLRDGIWKIMPANELVPGDIIKIIIGDFVPADAKVILGEADVDQSYLTGESKDIKKRRGDVLYSGSIVARGEANAVTILTGTKTHFGKIAQLTEIAHPKAHIEQVVFNILVKLILIVGSLFTILLVFSIFSGINPLKILPLMIVLLVGAIPVSLPAMFSVSTAIGSKELLKSGIIIKGLNAIEDAGSVDVLCIDKTGTITANRPSIAGVIAANGYTENEVILYGALASKETNNDPIDLAFINAANQRKLSIHSFTQENFIPFNPEARRAESSIKKDDKKFKVFKGAFDIISDLCKTTGKTKKLLDNNVANFAKKGYRTLAVAKVENRNKHELVGLIALHDAPRADSKSIIEELKKIGVAVKILTGDALPVANNVANEIGLDKGVLKASELKALAAKDPLEAAKMVDNTDGFAEIYPEDKYVVVKSLQSRGHVVGMTGDGVNDAPALKQAEIGAAVSTATDVAKNAANVILIKEGLSSLVKPINVGRKVARRINTLIMSKMIRTIVDTCFLVFTFIMFDKYIMSPAAIICISFLMNLVKISLAGDNSKPSKTPEDWDINRLTKISFILAIVTLVESMTLFYIGLKFFRLAAGSRSLATFAFEILCYSTIFSVFSIREKGRFWDSKPSKPVFATIILDVIAVTIISIIGVNFLELGTLPITQTLFVIVFSLVFMMVTNDSIKFAIMRKMEAEKYENKIVFPKISSNI